MLLEKNYKEALEYIDVIREKLHWRNNHFPDGKIVIYRINVILNYAQTTFTCVSEKHVDYLIFFIKKYKISEKDLITSQGKDIILELGQRNKHLW